MDYFYRMQAVCRYGLLIHISAGICAAKKLRIVQFNIRCKSGTHHVRSHKANTGGVGFVCRDGQDVSFQGYGVIIRNLQGKLQHRLIPVQAHMKYAVFHIVNTVGDPYQYVGPINMLGVFGNGFSVQLPVFLVGSFFGKAFFCIFLIDGLNHLLDIFQLGSGGDGLIRHNKQFHSAVMHKACVEGKGDLGS